MKLRSSIASVVAIFALALIVFMFASATPFVTTAHADGHGAGPIPTDPDTTDNGGDSTITVPDSPTIDNSTVIDWIVEAVSTLL